jgi:spermidine/putrescine transport system permease protein
MSIRWSQAVIVGYLILFFVYLFGPLVIMSITAFNSSAFPRISPWECLTFDWFVRLVEDQRLMQGLRNSVFIGIGVVFLAVAIGLAGALFLTQVAMRARSGTYALFISPILIPGVVLGIATVFFWDRVASQLGLGYGGLFYDGIFLTVLGQSAFIASYCMLVFLARLQRFDYQLVDAALDLGASNAQAFRRILLPFLKPAIGGAAVIAFLASFENYNTTVFTISFYNTFTVEVAQKVRLGIDPSISALAVIIIFLSLMAALLNEARQSHTANRLAGGKRGFAAFFTRNPAAVLAAFVLVAAIGVVAYAVQHDPAACQAQIMEERLERQRQLAPATTPRPPAATETPAAPSARDLNPGQGTFGDVFGPGGLAPTAPGSERDEPAPTPAPSPDPEARMRNPGQSTFGNVFGGGLAPGTTPAAPPAEQSTPEPAPAPEPQPDPEARMRNPGQSSFGDVFGSGLAPGSQVDTGSQ